MLRLTPPGFSAYHDFDYPGQKHQFDISFPIRIYRNISLGAEISQLIMKRHLKGRVLLRQLLMGCWGTFKPSNTVVRAVREPPLRELLMTIAHGSLAYPLKTEKFSGAGVPARQAGRTGWKAGATGRTFRNSSSWAFGSPVKHEKFMSALALNLEL
jgi:hypothetical protein